MQGLMKDMILLVDIDNVLNNFTETVLQYYNTEHDTKHTINDINQYGMEHALNIPFETLITYFESDKVLWNCTPQPMAQKYLKILNELCDIYIVTAREWSQLKDIKKWFEKYYPFISDTQMIRCRDKHMVRGDIRIDDHLDNLLNCPDGRVIFDYPWNRNIDDETNFLYRVTDWEHCFSTVMMMLGFDKKTIKIK